MGEHLAGRQRLGTAAAAQQLTLGASLAACSASSSMPFWPDPLAAWNEVGVIDSRPNRSRSTASTGHGQGGAVRVGDDPQVVEPPPG